MTGVDVSLAGIADLAHGQDNAFVKDGLGRVNMLVERAMSEFSAEHPEKIAPVLADGLKQTNALASQVTASTLTEQAKYDVLRELALKQEQFQHAIVLALGISLDATAGPKREPGGRNAFNNGPQESFAYAIPGQEFVVTVHLYNPQASALALNRVWLETTPSEKPDEKWTSRARIAGAGCGWPGGGDRSAIRHESCRTMPRPRVLISRGRMTSSRTTTFWIRDTAIFRCRPTRWRLGRNSATRACRCGWDRWCRRCAAKLGRAWCSTR